MRKFFYTVACIVVGIHSIPASAKDISNSKKLICAPMIAHQCIGGEKCTSGTPESVDIPDFFRIDLDKRVVVGETADNQERTSKISNVDDGKYALILQGTQLGRGWTAVIHKASGKMVVTLSADDIAIALFGSCTNN